MARLGLAAAFCASGVFAQEGAAPVTNWTAPRVWTKVKGMVASAKGDISYPLPFIAVTPCRIVDTRVAVADGFHAPNFSDNETRTFNFPASPDCTGLPSSAAAYSVNVQYRPISQPSFLTLFPSGTTMPLVSTLVGTPAGFTANAAIVPAGGGGEIDVYSQWAGRVVIDINGYYAQEINSSEYFGIVGSLPSGGIVFGDNTYTGGPAYGGNFGAASAADGAAGVHGEDDADPSGTYGTSGVIGTSTSQAGNAAGVRGVVGLGFNNSSCCGPVGVRGEGAFNGVAGVSEDRATVGVLVDSTGAWLAEGQLGKIGSSATQAYGVVGLSNGADIDVAAVLGRMTGTFAFQGTGNTGYAYLPGVRGDAGNLGVLGTSNQRGVQGAAYTSAGDDAGFGVLGVNEGVTTYGVVGAAGTSGTTNWAGYFQGDLGASGAKPFVEPHPSAAGKVIRYVALEGPEAGTFFRGRGRFHGGKATIEAPESFSLVTDGDGLTIQITPIGDFASVAVVSIGLDRIELKSSADVEFFYLVNGIRRSFRDWQVIVDGGEFMPESENATIPTYLSPEQKRYLIANGTYHEDGTVNMDTAERLGWTKVWAERAARMQATADRAGRATSRRGRP